MFETSKRIVKETSWTERAEEFLLENFFLGLPAGFLSRIEASLEGAQRAVRVKRWSCGFGGGESPEVDPDKKDFGADSGI